MVRKHTLDYDDVMNQQREVIYDYRNEVLHAEKPRELLYEVLQKQLPETVRDFLESEEPNYAGLTQWVTTTFPIGLTEENAEFASRDTEGNIDFLMTRVKEAYEKKTSLAGDEAVKILERHILLQSIDKLWQEHLYAMDSLRDGISNWYVAQKDPLVEYKKEAYQMFEELMVNIEEEVLNNLFRGMKDLQAFERFLQQMTARQAAGDEDENAQGGSDARKQPRPKSRGAGRIPMNTGVRSAADPAAAPGKKAAAGNMAEDVDLGIGSSKRELPKVGRNDPCPCGSGKKYKQCCGRRA
jgi:preprotein translocase subunit SecA